MTVDLRANEQVVKASDAKYFNNKKVEGKLIMTNQGVYFKSLDNNIEHNLDILFPSITDVMPYKIGLFSNTGLSIIKKTGKVYKFSVPNRNSWCEAINSKL